MAYRDDRQALSLQVAELERENEELREQVAALEDSARRERDAEHERRRADAFGSCVLCKGSLLPVAIFAGNNHRAPTPLNVSTLRFGDPAGGFTRSAPIKSKVCSSCGFIHPFIDITAPNPLEVGVPERDRGPAADDAPTSDAARVEADESDDVHD